MKTSGCITNFRRQRKTSVELDKVPKALEDVWPPTVGFFSYLFENMDGWMSWVGHFHNVTYTCASWEEKMKPFTRKEEAEPFPEKRK